MIKYTIIDENNDIIGNVTFKQLQELAKEINEQLWKDTPYLEDRITLESKDLTNIEDIKDTLEHVNYFIK
uniref:Uncharacterized protein n=1 Tax=Staphylococcus phage UHP46 TaxID=3234966 RepID=A0AB39C7Z5_9CAUD